MPQYPSISKNNPEFPNYLNFHFLRDIGIKHLQDLSGKIWTDYNLHDPGVTILEVLCYAITDLGYRNNLDIQDLLALNPADDNSRENNFFTPDEILTCNPVTDLDLCKCLIDIPGVRYARLEKVTPQTVTYPAIYVDYASSKLKFIPPDGEATENAPRLHPRGLYTVYIDLDLGIDKDANGQIFRSTSDILNRVQAVLCSYRNLCEDVYEIVVLEKEEIVLISDIELEADADGEDVLVEIYVRIQEFLSPHLHFYTLEELLSKGKTPAEIFAGRPAVINDKFDSHGFIDTAELSAITPPPGIHTSDLYQEILKVPGVAVVKKLSIINYINGQPQSQHPWYLQLTKGYSPQLEVKDSVKLFKGALEIHTNFHEVKRRYYEQQAAHIKAFREDTELDLSVPQGSYYNLADHYSIHHDFPLTYGISEEGLPETASASRRASALQLKGYLVFFDCLLANYLAQLAHVRDLFDWELDSAIEPQNGDKIRQSSQKHTYFTQLLNFPGLEKILDFPGLEEILNNPDLDLNDPKSAEIVPALKDYRQFMNSITEDSQTYRVRRNRFLDHLLARFAESFADYVLLNYRINQEKLHKVELETEIIHDKTQFLQEYPTLSRDRFRAFNYCNSQQIWNTENVSGFKKRVSRLLGIENIQRRDLSHYRIVDGWKISLSGSPEDIPLESSQTYPTRESARGDLEKLLQFATKADFYKDIVYRHPTKELTSYGYVLVDDKGEMLAENALRLSTEQEREIALQRWLSNIKLNQNQFKLTVEQANGNYYFTLQDRNQQDRNQQTLLRSLKDYPQADIAWKSAGDFAENLAYLNRYVSPFRYRDKSYSLGIVDQSGNLLAHSLTQANSPEALAGSRLEIFERLNNIESFLQIEAVPEQTSGYRFRLVDWSGTTLLLGTQSLGNESTTRDRFYCDVLGTLLEPDAIKLTTTNDFGFRVLSRPSRQSEIAIHPQTYKTAAERDAVIDRLFLLIRTARLSINIKQYYIGQIYGEDGQILLQSGKYDYEENQIPEASWHHGNLFMELAVNRDNFRLIDSENGLYGWEVTNKDNNQILSKPQYYTSELERQQGIESTIEALNKRINDEGFHVLEHILLRPKTKEDSFLPIYVRDDGTTREEQLRLTSQDPYSFWISVILPYWPERFRNMDFRRFVERTLRLEAPAHVALKIAWLDLRQMKEFEIAERNWREQLALDACEGSACNLTGALNRLVEIIPNLRSIYPKGTLHDSQANVTPDQPIILNQTALGTANEQ